MIHSLPQPEFQSISRGKVTTSQSVLWRVQDMRLHSVGATRHGDFLSSAVYLLYRSCVSDPVTSTRASRHVFLWVGAQSSQEAQGLGALKMLELDKWLGSGACVLHRECQLHESDRFLSHFRRRRIRYLNEDDECSTGSGGGGGGCRRRLFQLVNKRRTARWIELANVSWSAMHRRGVYVADVAACVFVWCGKLAHTHDRRQAIDEARRLQDERHGECNIVVVEDGDERHLASHVLDVFERRLFPLKDKAALLSPTTSSKTFANDDTNNRHHSSSHLRLYVCEEMAGSNNSSDDDCETPDVKIRMIEEKSGQLRRSDLRSDRSFIVDNGERGVWIWVGRRCGEHERDEAMRNLLGFLHAKQEARWPRSSFKPQLDHVQVQATRIIEGRETVEFRDLFTEWHETCHVDTPPHRMTRNKLTCSHGVEANGADNDAAGETQTTTRLWLVVNGDLVAVDRSLHGCFHTRNCYLVHHERRGSSGQTTAKHVLFYWIGQEANQQDSSDAAMLVSQMETSCCCCSFAGGNSLQVRLVEGSETSCFMSLFGGQITIRRVYRGETMRNLSSNLIFRVTSHAHSYTKIQEVEFSASSLATTDVLIVCCAHHVYYLWCGRASIGDERELAKRALNAERREYQLEIEAQESDEFWSALEGGGGGRRDSSSPSALLQRHQIHKCHMIAAPRLFEASLCARRRQLIGVQEIFEFDECDLSANAIMLLDATWRGLYVWIGSNAVDFTNSEMDQIAIAFLKRAKTHRDCDTTTVIYKVRQHSEPTVFTDFFATWTPVPTENQSLDYAKLVRDVEAKNDKRLFEIASQTQASPQASSEARSVEELTCEYKTTCKYTYKELKTTTNERLPENVRVGLKEMHLAEDEFDRVFTMSYEQFVRMPTWKRIEMKKRLHLF